LKINAKEKRSNYHFKKMKNSNYVSSKKKFPQDFYWYKFEYTEI